MNLVDHITHFCTGYKLPLDVVMAIARVESAMNPYAIRAEPQYRWLWDNLFNKPFRRLEPAEIDLSWAPDDFVAPHEANITADTEWNGQRMSWGPFQMMGALLRERGYKGDFPAICCEPELAARFACSHISNLRDKYLDKHGWAGVVAAYNAGRPRKTENGIYVNYQYVNKVSKEGGRKYVGFIQT